MLRFSAVVLAVVGLGCMCGWGPEVAEVPDEGVQTEVVQEAEAPVARGGWDASIDGVCAMERDCGCLEKATVQACAASLQASAAVFTPDVLGCIVSQPCAQMCGGGGVQCVKEGAARQSAALRAQHETTMGIINNFPNGGPCANGQTVVTDYSGNFVRCQ